MSNEFILPDLGEGIHEAEVLAVRIAEGDQVKEDQPILEVETDKAVVEIPCPVNGTIEKIHVKVGEVVKVGMVMVTFGSGGGAAKAPAKETAAETKQKQINDSIAAAPPIATAVSAGHATGNGKSTMEVRHNGVGPVPAAPATRRLARELNLDLRMIKGSGPSGRVTKEDVRSFAAGSLEGTISGASSQTHPIESKQQVAPAAVQSLASKYGESGAKAAPLEGGMGSTPVDLPDFTKFGTVERVPLKGIRRKIAQNMMQSWTHIPHVTTFDEADVTELDAYRAKYESEVKKHGGRLTLTVFALKAIASGLKKYPQFNASLDEKTGELVFKHFYNIGVAVATDRGLIVPVIRDVDKKSIIELSRELADLSEKTKAGKVELERLQGGTFTLTNIGSIGGTNMVPMINHPEAAILGMARAAQKPVVRNGNIEVGLIMPLALSFDHRIADGAEAAYFVQHVVKRLQEPFTFLLEA
ncbi:MAG: 2-oxo acid dehydrogenase subunit E2 [Cyanobacteria bacterium SZAS-4]|nr:2-oxo acid dehydrogenase subunit E2 [Cyanobacteria bacterium SZAS-4]